MPDWALSTISLPVITVNVINFMFSKKSFISGFLIVSILSPFASPFLVHADEEIPMIMACKEKQPDFLQMKKDLAKEVSETENYSMTPKQFEEKFNAARLAYHNYIECLSDYLEKGFWSIFESGFAETEGEFRAQVDWMLHDYACITDQELREAVLNKGNLTVFSSIALDTLKQYTDYLASEKTASEEDYYPSLMERYEFFYKKDTDDSDLSPLNAQLLRINQIGQAKDMIEKEEEMSKIALDTTLYSLDNLRNAFVIHVRFQCMIKYLDRYRKMAGNIRKIISDMKDRLKNASTTQ